MNFLLTDDDQTIVFNPHKPFQYNEVVTVSVGRGIRTLTNSELPEYSFSFKTETEGITQIYDGVFDEDITLCKTFLIIQIWREYTFRYSSATANNN